MPSYAIDSHRQAMTATGIVSAVQEWTETADGSRRPSDTQARDELTGMPLWGGGGALRAVQLWPGVDVARRG